MITLKGKFAGLFIVLMVGLLSLFAQSCQEEEKLAVAAAEPQQTTQLEPTMTPLSPSNLILQALKASDAVKDYNTATGTLLWEAANMVTYNSDKTLPLIMVPVDNGQEGQLTMFVAAYHAEKKSFHGFLNHFDAPTATTVDQGYTGTVAFNSVDNVAGVKMVYEQGALVEKELARSAAGYKGVNTDCFLHCIGDRMTPSLVTGMSATCVSAFGCCAGAPVPLNPCCAALAACDLIYGGIASYCAYDCWE